MPSTMNRLQLLLLAAIVLASFASGPLKAGAKELKLVESKRPFIDFEIKQLNFEVESRKRAFLDVKEPATGAVYLHESFFTDKSYIKCSAYGYLVSLMKDRPKEAVGSIRLSTIQELAVVVQRNWPYYHKLLTENSSDYVQEFQSIAERLIYSNMRKKSENSRDVALDLVNCARSLSPIAAGAASTGSRLAKLEGALNLWLMFKSEQIVSKRKSKVDRRTESDNSQLFYEDALKSIGNLDSKSRINLLQPQNESPIYVPKEAAASLKANGTLIESHEPLGVLLYLDKTASDEESKLKFPIFHREQLKVLNFVKFRLNDKKGRTFPVDVPLAIDFQTHWEALKNYVNKTSKPNQVAVEFFRNKDNAKLAKTIAYNLKLYDRFAIVFHRLSRKNFKFPSMKDYCNAIRKTKESLNKINKYDLIDIEDIYRVYDFWYSTHKQVCDVFWPPKNTIFEISN